MAETKNDVARQQSFSTFVAKGNFHNVFHFTRPQSQAPLRMTYADYGYREEGNKAVILICGPMISTRYLHIAKDALAKERKVRIIHPDRFGFGGSTDISLDERVRVWLEIVPALLQHLNIKHVSLMAQSGGTIYALNTLLYQRHLLHPTGPYIAIGAPWIHSAHSGATAMQLMKVFPNSVLTNLHSVARWFRSNVTPVTGFSENIVGTFGASLGSLFHTKATGNDAMGTETDDEAAFVFEEDLRPLIIDMAYAENMQGLSQEALLFLKRGNAYDWGAWEDYDRYVPMLATTEEAYRTPVPDAQKLRVDVFYAETDVMIGNSMGPKWFDDCWREAKRGQSIEYRARVVKGADHDGIFNLRWGAMHQVFTEVRSKSGE